MLKKALVINDYGDYFRPVEHTGLQYTNDANELWKDPESIGIIVFTGGEDVSPNLYGHEKHRTTGNSPKRDSTEKLVFDKALSHKKPLLGICRGAQFLCAMAGGSLVQDVTNHAGVVHKLAYSDPYGIPRVSNEYVTSSHHQMQNPYDLPADEYKVLAWTPNPLSTHYGIGTKDLKPDEVKKALLAEPDCVFYSKINALGIQYHPEWMDKESWGFKFAQWLVDKYLMPMVGTAADKRYIKSPVIHPDYADAYGWD